MPRASPKRFKRRRRLNRRHAVQGEARSAQLPVAHELRRLTRLIVLAVPSRAMGHWVNFHESPIKKEKVMIHQHAFSLIARGLLLFAACLFAFGVAAGQSATA